MRTVLAIVALVSVLTLLVVFYRGAQSVHDHQAAISKQIRAGLESKGKVLTENHALALRTLVENNSFGDVQQLVARTVREDSDVTTGMYLPTSGAPWAYFSPHHPPPATSDEEVKATEEWKTLDVKPASVTADAVRIDRKNWFGDAVYTFAKAVESEGEIVGTIHYAISTKKMREGLIEAKAQAERAMKTQLISLCLLAVLGLALGWALARRQAKLITMPLAILTEAASEVAKGKKGARVLVRCGDEIETLAGAFNKMVEDLEQSHDQLANLNRRLEETVRQRTQELSDRNDEMRVVLDNVEEGLVTLSIDGTLSSEQSAAFKRAFRVPANDAKLWDCVGANDERFSANLEFGWEQINDGFLPYDIALDQLPKELESNGRHFLMKYKPLFRSDSGVREPELKGALLIVSDVTEQQEAARKEAEQREAMAVFKRVVRDRSGFMGFFGEAQSLLKRAVSREVSDDREMMRVLHTLKGNCGIFGITSVASACHELETWVVENREIPSREMFAPLVTAFDHFVAQANELIGQPEDDAIKVHESDLANIIAALNAKSPVQNVITMLEHLRCEPTFECFRRIADQAEQLAQKMSKPELSVVIEDNGLRLPAEQWAPFWSSMIHIVRNALDHGIESPEERVNRGKNPSGTLTLSSKEVGKHFVIEVADDGSGVDWGKIREKAKIAGIPAVTHLDLTRALFADGLSSRDETTELSGRGVGMGAMLAACQEMGGEVEIQSERALGTRFIFRIPTANNSRTRRKVA